MSARAPKLIAEPDPNYCPRLGRDARVWFLVFVFFDMFFQKPKRCHLASFLLREDHNKQHFSRVAFRGVLFGARGSTESLSHLNFRDFSAVIIIHRSMKTLMVQGIINIMAVLHTTPPKNFHACGNYSKGFIKGLHILCCPPPPRMQSRENEGFFVGIPDPSKKCQESHVAALESWATGQTQYIWVFPKIVGFPPKSSILIGFSIVNHQF